MRNEMQPGLQKVSNSMRELAADATKSISLTTKSITTVGDMDLGAATGRGIKKATKGMQKEFKGMATKIGAFGNSVKGKAQELLQESMVIGDYTIRVQHLIAEGGFSEVFLVKVSCLQVYVSTASAQGAHYALLTLTCCLRVLHLDTICYTICKDGVSGEAMALKRVLCQSDEAEKDAKWEINVHKSVNHPNVLKLIDSASGFYGNGRSVKAFLLLFPLCERGSVWDAVEAILDKTVYEKTDTGAAHPFPVSARQV
jgi:hypothetical protein